MISGMIKNILKDIFEDEIQNVVEKKVGTVIEDQIANALAPSLKKISELNETIDEKIDDINRSVIEKMEVIREVASDSLEKSVETLPSKLKSVSIDLGDTEEYLNDKIQEVLRSEILSPAYNPLVDRVRGQFTEFVEEHDLMKGIR